MEADRIVDYLSKLDTQTRVALLSVFAVGMIGTCLAASFLPATINGGNSYNIGHYRVVPSVVSPDCWTNGFSIMDTSGPSTSTALGYYPLVCPDIPYAGITIQLGDMTVLSAHTPQLTYSIPSP